MVVSGGFSYHSNGPLSLVEAYDHTLDEWVEMPEMIYGRYRHSQLTVNNKMFIIGGGLESCESFDSISQKFVFINDYRGYGLWCRRFEAVSVGNKIVVYYFNENQFSIYDIEQDEWFEEDFKLTQTLERFSCVKVPHLDY